MTLELVSQCHREWKDTGKWKSLYCNTHSLIDYYGQGSNYIRLMNVKDRSAYILGSCVSDLADVLSETNGDKSVEQVSRRPLKKMPKKAKFELAETEIRDLGEDSADILVDCGYLDGLAVEDNFSVSLKSWVQMVMKKAEKAVYVITVGHEPLIREFIRWSTGCNFEITISPVRLPFNPARGSVPVIIEINKEKTITVERYPNIQICTQAFTKRDNQECSILRVPALLKEWRRLYYLQNVVPSHHAGSLRLFDIVESSTGETYYSLSMYDRVLDKTSPKKKNLKACVAVMVPLADEHHWLYRTPSGHQRLAEKAGTLRVLCVFLPNFKPLMKSSDEVPAQVVERIRKDIGSHLLSLNPNPATPVLLMTQQERFEDERKSIAISSTADGDELMVYDVVVDQQDEEFKENPDNDSNEVIPPSPSEYTRRTMIFSSNPRCAQTELWFKGPSDNPEFRYTHVCHSYQIPILRVVCDYIERQGPSTGAILGIGGGLMPSLFNKVFGRKVHLDCVDIEAEVVNMAKKAFGYDDAPDYRNTVIRDAVDYIAEKSLSEDKLDFVVVDINGTSGATLPHLENVTGPHRNFLTSEFLSAARKAVKAEGLVILNAVCQVVSARKQLGSYLKPMFPNVMGVAYGDELNVVYVCSANNWHSGENPFIQIRKRLLASAQRFPALADVVTDTPLYLGERSRMRANVISF
ncbi:putative methyltransferase [Gregarina niphandrodes]|uniref:Methyltransferase n=1 Tax=Gregarina niphandrodes TaxID=110365 RepID=A0A023AZ59_GRENI|nr:putative methyltransferase [Gregarina niphandrodes]EZG43934.1 putative methyltransferase [Gregarina niphandrodes]|eukprot:XP_011132905.1 putative methyltransferase [Gregarina niphandrodes]